jgi:site-specific DNA recombinase
VVAESLDRLSHDLADVATLYKHLSYLGVRLWTVAEGLINELHAGLKGTMGASTQGPGRQDPVWPAGRIEAGKSGRQQRRVRRRQEDWRQWRPGPRRPPHQPAAGHHRQAHLERLRPVCLPRTIAKELNSEGVPGLGQGLDAEHDSRQRQHGTGVLNNERYTGEQVWNRLRFIKDPQTGRRISRLNPESEWIIGDVPELRIIDQDLWGQVKARQGALQGNRSRGSGPGYWDRRRPRYLFTGLMRCGMCSGGVATWNRVYVGCVNARNKGTCTNKTTMRRDDLETAVLEGLQHRLMDPDLMAVFCEEYTRHMNALTREHNAAREGAKAELSRVNRNLDRLVQALLDGAPARTVKDRMAHLEARKEVLEAQFAQGEDMKISVHPSMASTYRERVAHLREALAKEGCQTQAAEIMRTLIDKIVLTPVCRDGKETLSITLQGDLAGILGLAAKAKVPLDESGPVVECTKLVAGARFGFCALFVAPGLETWGKLR